MLEQPLLFSATGHRTQTSSNQREAAATGGKLPWQQFQPSNKDCSLTPGEEQLDIACYQVYLLWWGGFFTCFLPTFK